MANPQKSKGDRAEREALEYFICAAPDLVRDNPMRMLGAGRKDDIGDLAVFDDVVIQVKGFKNLTAALRQGADGARAQSRNALLDLYVGMAPIPRARKTGLRWLASSYVWPGISGDLALPDVPQVGNTGRAVEIVRESLSPVIVSRAGHDPMVISPIDVWLGSYRSLRESAVLV